MNSDPLLAVALILILGGVPLVYISIFTYRLFNKNKRGWGATYTPGFGRPRVLSMKKPQRATPRQRALLKSQITLNTIILIFVLAINIIGILLILGVIG